MSYAPFPRWSTGAFRWALATAVPLTLATPCVLMAWVRTDYVTGSGELAVQPVMFDHRHHVVDDGIDCRYCHWGAERSAYAGIPAASVCMNCHAQVWKDSPALAIVRASAASGEPIRWTRVHSLPDFVFFNHAAHVRRGVGCVSCHGRVDEMARITQARPMTMSWCLDCHRHPQRELRPLDHVTDMAWKPMGETQEQLGTRLVVEQRIDPPTACSGCHR
jgi:hypothetical protein